MAAIEVRNLRKTYRVVQKPQGLAASLKALFVRRYKEVRAVGGIDFTIEPGEMVGFLGPNGAGKTTTLKMLSGLIYPTGGEAKVLGFVPWERKNAYRRQFALLMGQKNQLWWDLPASESFRLHKEIYDIEERKFLAVQEELTTLLNVQGLLDQPVRELSLGERMKMELIAALLHSPQILFLDEPTIGLDVVAQSAIRRCLREYNERRRVTVLLTSHYMQDIEALCDRVMVINHGRLVHDGPLAEIVSRFSAYKLLTLRFADGVFPESIREFGEVVALRPPEVTLRLPRAESARRAGEILRTFDVIDLRVGDPPIEEVISAVFAESAAEPGETRSPRRGVQEIGQGSI
ncbi:MAG: ABC transporter ATP-binding protein [Phycisphaerae bacterium]|nr:ABC transporter ATP-binding protein [Phycisphaerae bacterium]